jgi:hypothetical protein
MVCVPGNGDEDLVGRWASRWIFVNASLFSDQRLGRIVLKREGVVIVEGKGGGREMMKV